MRRLIIFLLFLLASVWFGLKVMRHQGYLFLVYQPWMVQMPIWFAALVLVIFVLLFYFVVTSVDRLQLWWLRFQHWLQYRREHRAYSKTRHGLTTLVEGRWKKAEKLLLAGTNQSVEPLMNYLGGARAAHEQGEYARRDMYLQKAYHVAPDAEIAIGMTQAELELSQEHYEKAAATLNQLLKKSPRHPGVLRLLEKVYVRSANWKNLQTILPMMRKARVLTSDQFEQFEINVACEILRNDGKTLAAAEQLWDSLPRYVRKNPDVIYAYVQRLLALQRPSDAVVTQQIEELIRKALKTGYQPELVTLYGTLPFTDLNKQLVIVGAWLKMYGLKPEILLTLGRFCARLQLWGKAKDYFEKCLMQGKNPAASFEYGRLLENLGEQDAAMAKYREGLV